MCPFSDSLGRKLPRYQRKPCFGEDTLTQLEVVNGLRYQSLFRELGCRSRHFLCVWVSRPRHIWCLVPPRGRLSVEGPRIHLNGISTGWNPPGTWYSEISARGWQLQKYTYFFSKRNTGLDTSKVLDIVRTRPYGNVYGGVQLNMKRLMWSWEFSEMLNGTMVNSSFFTRKAPWGKKLKIKHNQTAIF